MRSPARNQVTTGQQQKGLHSSWPPSWCSVSAACTDLLLWLFNEPTLKYHITMQQQKLGSPPTQPSQHQPCLPRRRSRLILDLPAPSFAGVTPTATWGLRWSCHPEGRLNRPNLRRRTPPIVLEPPLDISNV